MGKKAKGQPANTAEVGTEHNATDWIQQLARISTLADRHVESRMRTAISCCGGASGVARLFIPPDMASLQPRSLRFLHTFARQNDFRLVEDRRRVEVQPVSEQREQAPPKLALGLSMLLRQTGMPGSAVLLSSPHRLNADSTYVPLNRLIRMASMAIPACKRVVILPNKMIVDVLDEDTQPIAAFACKLNSAQISTVLCHFDSDSFRAIGYSTGSQYVIHVFLAGGPLKETRLWTHVPTLRKADMRFQLFPSQSPANDFGLLYTTHYFDLAKAKPTPWWLSDKTLNPIQDTHLQSVVSGGAERQSSAR